MFLELDRSPSGVQHHRLMWILLLLSNLGRQPGHSRVNSLGLTRRSRAEQAVVGCEQAEWERFRVGEATGTACLGEWQRVVMAWVMCLERLQVRVNDRVNVTGLRALAATRKRRPRSSTRRFTREMA